MSPNVTKCHLASPPALWYGKLDEERKKVDRLAVAGRFFVARKRGERLMNIGRRVIWTDEREITERNVVRVLQDSWADYAANKADCDFLLRYEAGEQPLQRKKTYRPDIDIVCVDNVANEVTNFWTGFMFGNEITYVQRGRMDSGKGNTTEHEGAALMNECFAMEMGKAKTAELGRYVQITGIGYTFIDVNMDYQDGDSFFRYVVIDPRYAFVVRSKSHTDHRIVMAATVREDSMGNRYYTVFTNRERFEIVGSRIITGRRRGNYDYFHSERSGDANPLGIIPIVEWVRDYDRMGCFERQISALDTLNIEESDFANLVDQNCQAIWHANDVEFAKDENGNTVNPKSNDWVFTQTTRDGKTPFITPLAVPSEYTGIMQNITTKRAMILQKCNVPQRNDNSGGSTGVAMSDATGWSQAEVEASKQQSIIEGCKMQEARIALAAIQVSPFTPSDSPLLKIRYADIAPSVKRQKNYEMVSKVNAFATLVSHGVHGLHAIRVINLFDDPQQVYEDSSSLIKKFQNSIFDKTQTTANIQERAGSDESDQIENSPNIDGMERKSPDGEDEGE